MERRDFLRFTAVTSSLAALYPPSAEALPALSGAGGSDEEMDRFLRHLDGVMARSRERAFLEPFRPLAEGPKEPVAQAAARRQEELFGKILRSLMMVGSFSDLPEQGQRHPGMQRRLRERAQEVDEALYGTLDLLGNLSPAERLDLTQAFREEPDLALRLGETLDAQAAHAGISMKRRLHLRRMITHLTWRIKHQGASAVVEDYVAQVRRAATADGLGAAVQQRWMAALGEEAFWAQQRRLAGMALAWDTATPGRNSALTSAVTAWNTGAPAPPPPVPTPTDAPPAPVVPQASDDEVPGRGAPLPPRTVAPPRTFTPPSASLYPPGYSPPRRVLRAGLIMLGVSAGVAATGGLLMAIPGGGGFIAALFLFTPAALLLLAALITLLVAAATGR